MMQQEEGKSLHLYLQHPVPVRDNSGAKMPFVTERIQKNFVGSTVLLPYEHRSLYYNVK